MVKPSEIAVASLGKPHGVRGEIELKLISESPDRVVPGATFHLSPPAGTVTDVTVETVRSKKNVLLVRMAGVNDRARAESLRGSLLVVPPEDLPELDADTYYHFDLVGMRVLTIDGRELGRVAEILETGANDVYVVRAGELEVLVPAIKSVVRSIDTEANEMTIEPLPGLLPEDADED